MELPKPADAMEETICAFKLNPQFQISRCGGNADPRLHVACCGLQEVWADRGKMINLDATYATRFSRRATTHSRGASARAH